MDRGIESFLLQMVVSVAESLCSEDDVTMELLRDGPAMAMSNGSPQPTWIPLAPQPTWIPLAFRELEGALEVISSI
jgi:hypothetical protein